MRPHVAAVYAFARTADDFADEDGLTLPERHALLDDWHARLMRAAGKSADVAPGLQSRRTRESRHTPIDPDLVFEALGDTIRTCSLDVTLFEDLLSAFRQDTVVTRYAAWEDVFDYCRRSANPVGRLVLHIAGYRDAELEAGSDALCTALQLTNFWQDLATDVARDHVYLPAEDLHFFGVTEADIKALKPEKALRDLIRFEVARTRALYEKGRPLLDKLHRDLRLELTLIWLVGNTILDKIEAADYDVFTQRPTIRRRDQAVIMARAAKEWATHLDLKALKALWP